MTKEELFQKLQDCKECRHHDWIVNIHNPVAGYGKFGAFTYSNSADVMIVGQNPSKNRDPQPLNHSLSGRQGDLFRKIFGKESLILTNIVQVSTPDNKIEDADADHGFKHLMDEVAFYKPKAMILLGAYAQNCFKRNFKEFEKVTSEASVKIVRFLRHPDFYMSYYPQGLNEYVDMIQSVYNAYLQIDTNVV